MSSIYGPSQPERSSAEAEAWTAPVRSWRLRIRPWVAWAAAVAAVVRFVIDPDLYYVGAFVALAASGACWWMWVRGRQPLWAWALAAPSTALGGLWLLAGR
jgi:hypothetical protein